MTRAVSFRLLFSVIPEHFFCHSERSEESSVDAALSVTGTLTSPQPSPSQKERDIFAIPSASEESTHGCFTTLSMTGWGQQTSPSGPSPCKRRGTFWRKPKQGEVSSLHPVWLKQKETTKNTKEGAKSTKVIRATLFNLCYLCAIVFTSYCQISKRQQKSKAD